MADTTQEVLTLENDTPVRTRGRVKVVFNMSSGEGRYGTWYRQDFILADDQGEVKVAWFDPGPTEKMGHLAGQTVEVQGKVNHHTNTKANPPERMTSIKAAGGDAVRMLSGAPPAPPPAQATHTPPRAGSAPQGASPAVERQGAGQSPALPLAEYQRWWLARWEWYEGSPVIQRAISRGEAVAVAIRDAIGAEWMSQPPAERDIERSPYPGVARAAQVSAPPSQGGVAPLDPYAESADGKRGYPDGSEAYPRDDDESIPF